MQFRTFIAAAACLAGSLCFAGPKRFDPDPASRYQSFYPEGPQLTKGGLLVAEMPRDRVVLITGAGTREVWHSDGCGPTSVKAIPGKGYWILCHLGARVVRVDQDFAEVAVISKSPDRQGVTWPNDASVDSAGNLYLSSSGLFHRDAPATGRLLFIAEANNAVRVLAGDIKYANGVLVQEKLHRVLVSETLHGATGRVLSFRLERPGELSGERSVFFDLRNAPAVQNAYEQGGPDGIAAFPDGDLLVANYGNRRVLHLSSDGKFISQVEVPLPYVTNMAITPDGKGAYIAMTRDNASDKMDGIVQFYKVQGK